MKDMASALKQVLLTAPESQLDPSMFPLIEKWDDPPRAIQLLEAIDKCIYSSLSSGFVLTGMQLAYKRACENEGVTHEELVPSATWRAEQD